MNFWLKTRKCSYCSQFSRLFSVFILLTADTNCHNVFVLKKFKKQKSEKIFRVKLKRDLNCQVDKNDRKITTNETKRNVEIKLNMK